MQHAESQSVIHTERDERGEVIRVFISRVTFSTSDDLIQIENTTDSTPGYTISAGDVA